LESSPKRPAVKLHSPILDRGAEPEPSPGRPRPFGKSALNSSDAVRPKRPAPNNDQDFNNTGGHEPPVHRKGGLRSPLLDFDDEDVEGEYQPQNKGKSSGGGGGMFPHRSNSRLNNTGGQPVDQEDLNQNARPIRPNKGLRSPLLGGDDEYEDMDETPPSVTNKGTPSRLRSPVLGGGGRNQKFQSQPDYDDVVEDENPNLLRSPLLAARAPIQDKVKAPQPPADLPKPAQPAKPFVSPPEPSPPQPSTPVGNPWGSPAAVFSGQTAGPFPAPVSQPDFVNAPPAQGWDNAALQSVNAAPPGQPEALPQWGALGQTTGPATSSPASDLLSGGYGTLPSAPSLAPKIATPTSHNAPSRPAPGADSGTDSGGASRTAARSYGDALPSNSSSPSKRSVTSSRLLPVDDESHSLPSRPPGYAGFGKFMALPLGASVAFKLWYLHDMGATAFSSPSFLADQLGQAVVIICVLVFTLMVSSEPRH
jgi:hypothetical protein